MKIATSLAALVHPGLGLEKGSITALVQEGEGGRPDVLAAQILVNTALDGTRVLMLLPRDREQDETWKAMVSMFTNGDDGSAGRDIGRLPINMHSCGTGWDRVGQAGLVYAPGLNFRDLRRLGAMTEAPILMLGKTFDGESSACSTQIIRVSAGSLVLQSEEFEIPVVYDPSGPIYRPA